MSGNWYQDEENRRRQEAIDLQQRQIAAQIQEEQRKQDAMQYMETIYRAFDIENKLTDIVKLLREGAYWSGKYRIAIHTPYRDLEVVYSRGVGRPPEYTKAHSTPGGEYVHSRLIRKASWDYQAPKPISLKQTVRQLVYYIEFDIDINKPTNTIRFVDSAKSDGRVDFYSDARHQNDIFDPIVFHEQYIDRAVTLFNARLFDLVPYITQRQDWQYAKEQEILGKYPNLPIQS